MFDSWKKDEMTSLERMAAFASGKPIDRIPCVPMMGETMTKGLGIKATDYYHDPKLMAEVEVRCYEMFHHDGVGIGPGLHGISEAMGTKLAFQEHSLPYVSDPLLKDYADFNHLTPVDPYKDGRLPLILEAINIIKEKIGDQVGVGSFIGGPFTIAASLRGTENLLKDMIKNPEMAHQLLKIATESAFSYIDAVSDLGVVPGIAEPTASCTVMSRKKYQEFVTPYLKMTVDKIVARSGQPPLLHICGQTDKIWEDMVDSGAGVISLDNIVDMEAAKKSIGHRACLMGNIKPVETMKLGKKQDIIREAQDCMRTLYDNPRGYILATGCQLPLDTPFENIEYLMDAARTFGRYPIDPEKWQGETL